MKPNQPVFDFTVLGSGTCAVTQERSCAGYALRCQDQLYMLDMGFGTLRRMTQATIDYREIDAVLITHEHLDHSGDLVPFLMALHHTPGFIRRKPLTIIGPSGFYKFLKACRALYGNWVLESEGFDLSVHEMSNDRLDINKCTIKAYTMHHSRPTIGYRIEYRECVLAYSGDTGACANLISLNQDADLAVLECSFPDQKSTEYHLTPEQAGTFAAKSGCKHLLLTHLYPMMDSVDIKTIVKKHYKGSVTIAEDLERIYL